MTSVAPKELRLVLDTQDTYVVDSSMAAQEVDTQAADIDIGSTGIDMVHRYCYYVPFRTNELVDAITSAFSWREDIRMESSMHDMQRDVVRSSNVVGHVSSYVY